MKLDSGEAGHTCRRVGSSLRGNVKPQSSRCGRRGRVGSPTTCPDTRTQRARRAQCWSYRSICAAPPVSVVTARRACKAPCVATRKANPVHAAAGIHRSRSGDLLHVVRRRRGNSDRLRPGHLGPGASSPLAQALPRHVRRAVERSGGRMGRLEDGPQSRLIVKADLLAQWR